MKLGLLFQRGKVNAEIARVYALQSEGNVVSLIHLLDSDLRGATRYSVVRGHAVTALGKLGDPRAIPYLIEVRHDPEDIVRMDVMTALGQLGTKEAEDAVSEGLRDPAALVRMSAAEALGRMGAVNAIPLLRSASDSDPNPEVRLSAVESLVILGDESARDRVPEALGAISRRVRSHPRYKRLREVAESGEPLTPWVSAWEK
jgi:HEAT repeat protein